MKFSIAVVLFLLVGMLAQSGCAQDAAGPSDSTAQTPETGRVAWSRDLDAALARSRMDGRPVLVLFQEIPG